ARSRPFRGARGRRRGEAWGSSRGVRARRGPPKRHARAARGEERRAHLAVAAGEPLAEGGGLEVRRDDHLVASFEDGAEALAAQVAEREVPAEDAGVDQAVEADAGHPAEADLFARAVRAPGGG